ncbi:MAG: dihydroxy-acid dehydratase [Thermoproteota archaeon]|nr:dihydroxy-acid dehydratase [Thermoproteota archaeon]
MYLLPLAIVVIRYEGPKGGPGMREMLSQLLQAEVLKLAEQLENQLLAKCVKKTISSTLNGIYDEPSFSFDNQYGDRTHVHNRK